MYIVRKLQDIYSLLKCVYKPKLLLLPVISAIITYLCVQQGFVYNMQIAVSFFFIGTFFVFSVVMNTVNARRFSAIDEISSIKAYVLSIYETASIQKITTKKERKTCSSLLQGLQDFLQEETCDHNEYIYYIDTQIKGIANIGEKLRKNGFPSPEISRIQQQTAEIRNSFERLISIKEIRTPKSLKLFTYLSIPTSIIILSPAFAALGIFGVIISTIVAFLLSLLLLVQNDIENPFGHDLDDINFDFVKRFEKRLDSL